MSQLHELLAVMSDTTNTAKMAVAEGKTTFAKKPDHFKGQTRSIKYFDESRSEENVSETKQIVTTVDEKIAHITGLLGRHYDALLQMEATNQTARADVIINGETLLESVPATFLLGMETRLKDLRELVSTVPTLEPAVVWTEDVAAGDGVFRSAPQINMRTEKELKYKVLYEATDKHPAQIEKWNVDTPVARIETVHTSGMWTPARKSRVMGRIDTLIEAVKKARQRANCVEVVSNKVADYMFDYVFDD